MIITKVTVNTPVDTKAGKFGEEIKTSTVSTFQDVSLDTLEQVLEQLDKQGYEVTISIKAK